MPPLPIIGELLRRQRRYYEVVSTWERRRWGGIALDPDNPRSHDSNHAYIDQCLAPDRLAEVLDEVAHVCAAHGVEPRVRYHVPPHSPELAQRAQAMGWRGDCVEERWRAWPAEEGCVEARELPGLVISRAEAGEVEDLLAVQSEGVDDTTAFRHRRIWLRLLADDGTDCVLARVWGEPAARLACLWSGEWGCVENVRTREQFRRRGICTAMIRFVQQAAGLRGARGLFLYDSDDLPDRIYAGAGFQLVSRLRQVQLTRRE